VATILGQDQPLLQDPQMVIFAADHGLAARGVSAYPTDVTWQMVENFLAGGGGERALAHQRHPFEHRGLRRGARHCPPRTDPEDKLPKPGEPRLWRRKVAYGTQDSSVGPAMTDAECRLAIQNGMALVKKLPGNALLLGEMGIGNTSCASLLLARLANIDVASVSGMGTGLDAEGVRRKVEVLRAVLDLHAGVTEPLAVLAAMGGLEVATMVGAVLQAAAERRVILVDGFITSAAVLVPAGCAQRCWSAACMPTARASAATR
jgi:nicotinate-nucleotide--dimethylbenzimidazole phosphoribosyltransferase